MYFIQAPPGGVLAFGGPGFEVVLQGAVEFDTDRAVGAVRSARFSARIRAFWRLIGQFVVLFPRFSLRSRHESPFACGLGESRGGRFRRAVDRVQGLRSVLAE